MAVTINFISNIADPDEIRLVLYQKQVNPDFNREIIAWKVIAFDKKKPYFQFIHKTGLHVSLSDIYGNFTRQWPVEPGKQYEVPDPDPGQGNQLFFKNMAVKPGEIRILNSLSRGAFNVNCFRSGLLLARWHNVIPGEEVIFEFQPFIYMVFCPKEEVTEGEVMNPSIYITKHAQLSLRNLKHIDVELSSDEPGQYNIGFKHDSPPLQVPVNLSPGKVRIIE